MRCGVGTGGEPYHPVLPEIASTMGADKIKLVKINTENYPKIASSYKVEALPTMILFKGGKQVDRIEGVAKSNLLATRTSFF